MNKILSTLLEPKNWLEVFLDNKEEYSEDFVKALEFIDKQKLSKLAIREYEGSISFVFEYEKWEDLPECIRKLTITNENGTYENYIFVDLLNITRVYLYLYDISEKSDFIYEDFMHSLGDDTKKYIAVDINID